jgi:hypothetical protein
MQQQLMEMDKENAVHAAGLSSKHAERLPKTPAAKTLQTPFVRQGTRVALTNKTNKMRNTPFNERSAGGALQSVGPDKTIFTHRRSAVRSSNSVSKIQKSTDFMDIGICDDVPDIEYMPPRTQGTATHYYYSALMKNSRSRIQTGRRPIGKSCCRTRRRWIICGEMETE